MMKQQGATLIGVLIALLILAVGLVALVKFQGQLMRNRIGLSQQTEAMVLARNKLAELRHYVVINPIGGLPAYQNIASGTSTQSDPNTSYNLAWTVTDVLTPPHKIIRVDVSWIDSSNTSQTVTLDSIIGKTDPRESGKVAASLP